MDQPKEYKALFLRAEGDDVVLEIEVEKGKWVELIREKMDSPFSHIIEPLGIKKRVKDGITRNSGD